MPMLGDYVVYAYAALADYVVYAYAALADYVVYAFAGCSLVPRPLFKVSGNEADAGCSPQAKTRNQSYRLHEGVQISLGEKCLDDIGTLLPYEVVAKSAERKISYL